MNLKTQFTEMHYNKDAKNIKLLDFCSLFYGALSRLKNLLYDKGILKPVKVNAFVISVGNITTGGVGKTPVTAEIARYFKDQKTVIISRGYGGKLNNKKINVISDGKEIFYDAETAGDEPFWLAQNTNAAVITSKNRIKAAEYATERFGAEKIILDDGFQHRKLHRDLDLVLTDSKMRFGNEKLLPAGPLREGKEAFPRIDNLIVVSKNTDHSQAEKLAKILAEKMSIPVSVCCTEPEYIYNIKTGARLEAGASITAICAIGQPQQFYDFLADYNIVRTVSFDDHHRYEPEDIDKISGVIVTTEKDAVKLQKFNNENIYALKLKTRLNIKEILHD
ncbi:MAG: tetraacyldisaccharide 4'-kinase [Heliobacteriaceae bacterium]|jgi:tetraacyldisaccharide 4'-kinase|nr:tetraacyldisaccharide 4'-kinase [Heliobacteriaceae bacterium]